LATSKASSFFNLQGDLMLVVDQKGDSLQHFSINSTGHLVSENQELTNTPPQPAYVTFLTTDA
jgi:6-phosphogluconolactonase (cycloisomerase 2 family)